MAVQREVQFPEKALPLFKPAPYKVMYGGRGGSKTWDFCRALLILGSQRPLFILCAREIQKSIADSVHRVLATQAEAVGLGSFYQVFNNKILGQPLRHHSGALRQTEFVFAGIRNDITAIKSMEAIDICAVFEATFVSQHSWDVLLPTIRGDPPAGPFGKGSEVWIEFNPELGTDETYKRWVLNPPPETVVLKVNWRDNPFFPEFLRKQKDEMRRRDYDNYLTIWDGQVRRVVQGAIYAKQLELAAKEGRISPHIKLDRSKPVDIGVDLGRGDMTSLWFMQQHGLDHHAIGYYGNFGYDWAHYLEEIQSRKIIVGKIYLPHDADNKVIQARKSIKAQTEDVYPGPGKVVVVPRTPSVVNDINAVRLMFSRLFFNEADCADGLTGLAHYHYDVDPETKQVSREPKHDWASHPADGLRTYVMGLRAIGSDRAAKSQKHVPQAMPSRGDRVGWLAG